MVDIMSLFKRKMTVGELKSRLRTLEMKMERKEKVATQKKDKTYEGIKNAVRSNADPRVRHVLAATYGQAEAGYNAAMNMKLFAGAAQGMYDIIEDGKDVTEACKEVTYLIKSSGFDTSKMQETMGKAMDAMQKVEQSSNVMHDMLGQIAEIGQAEAVGDLEEKIFAKAEAEVVQERAGIADTEQAIARERQRDQGENPQ